MQVWMENSTGDRTYWVYEGIKEKGEINAKGSDNASPGLLNLLKAGSFHS